MAMRQDKGGGPSHGSEKGAARPQRAGDWTEPRRERDDERRKDIDEAALRGGDEETDEPDDEPLGAEREEQDIERDPAKGGRTPQDRPGR